MDESTVKDWGLRVWDDVTTASCTLWGRHNVMIIHGILCFIVCKRIGGQLRVVKIRYGCMLRPMQHARHRSSLCLFGASCLILVLNPVTSHFKLVIWFTHLRISSEHCTLCFKIKISKYFLNLYQVYKI